MAAEDVLREDGRLLAQARERFLTVDPLQPEGVRQAILASWWRSREASVAADRLELIYVRDPDLDTPLTRSAQPVLERLREQLDGQPVSIVLTDATGMVLSRMVADAALARQLDRVSLAPGFSYAESVVGTNGIGTALEAGRPMHVFGHEHYAEDLEQLACAGVPVRHPVSGKTVGVLDLTCWRKDAGPLLVTLAKTTAEQIRQELLTETGMREIELLHAYLRACHHSAGMVFALNNDVVMMNATARDSLDTSDQGCLLQHAAQALAQKRATSSVELPSGLRVRLSTRPVRGDGRLAGGVIDVHVVESGAGVQSTGLPVHPMLLPGLVGAGSLWRRACLETEEAHRAGGWLVVEGESGAGKLALLRAVHQRHDQSHRFRVVDGSQARPGLVSAWLEEVRGSLSDPDGTVVLQHLEQVPAPTLRLLTAELEQAARVPGPWVAVTVPEGDPPAALYPLLRLFPSTVHVPPLRHHIDDVPALVAFLLQRLGCTGTLTCSAEAMQVLMRSPWPGNVQQVLDVLRLVLKHRRAGVVQPADLPPELQSLSRRRLTTMESLERDAIVMGLQDAAGNKAEAARALGMSRATIYRKIHDFGIT